MSSLDDKQSELDPTRNHCEFSGGLVITCLGIVWLLRFLGPLSLLTVPIVLGAVIASTASKRWLAVTALLLLNPIGMSFAGGVLEYASGRPTLRFVGLPGLESFNIDPQLRCRRNGGGCCVSGDEWIPVTIHNLAVRLAINTFGLPHGAYDGPYPTQDEAEQALTTAEAIALGDFVADRIVIEGTDFQLEDSVGMAIVDGLRFWMIPDPEKPEEEVPEEWKLLIHGCVIEDRCLIVTLQQSELGLEYICLIDTKRGRPFAYYEINGTRPHPPVRYDEPPLLAGVMRAAEDGDIDGMKRLLQNGADINVRTETGRTPLMDATQCGQFQMVRFLIEQGADVNLQDNGRHTCLYLLSTDDGTICRMLLDAGVNIHHHDGRTGSPLMYAAAYGRSPEVVRLLVDAGSPLDQKDDLGRTLIELAELNDAPGIAESLKQAISRRRD